MQIATHKTIEPTLCGTVMSLEPGRSVVRMTTVDCMAADETNLVHGGFVFGMADYAAMVAINEPTVVLGAAEVKFLKPVVVGQTLEAHAALDGVPDKKHFVNVRVLLDGEEVFTGRFTCFVPKRHVLDKG